MERSSGVQPRGAGSDTGGSSARNLPVTGLPRAEIEAEPNETLKLGNPQVQMIIL